MCSCVSVSVRIYMPYVWAVAGSNLHTFDEHSGKHLRSAVFLGLYP